MPKMKTKSSLKKRVKVTANGKLMRGCAYRSRLAPTKQQNKKDNYERLD